MIFFLWHSVGPAHGPESWNTQPRRTSGEGPRPIESIAMICDHQWHHTYIDYSPKIHTPLRSTSCSGDLIIICEEFMHVIIMVVANHDYSLN